MIIGKNDPIHDPLRSLLKCARHSKPKRQGVGGSQIVFSSIKNLFFMSSYCWSSNWYRIDKEMEFWTFEMITFEMEWTQKMITFEIDAKHEKSKTWYAKNKLLWTQLWVILQVRCFIFPFDHSAFLFFAIKNNYYKR